jgi:glycosyltransferase involved in cell wall biosynthesis
MRFHILGLPHSKAHRDYSVCAFSMKVYHLAAMLTRMNYEVFVYAPEGSNPQCKEMVSCLSNEEYDRLYPEDFKKVFFNFENPEGWRIFNTKAAEGINARKQTGDVILSSIGFPHDAVKQATGLPVIELGIGHNSSKKENFRIFESYAWMNYVYGREDTLHPNNYDAVIPAYYDLSDYTYRPKKENYFCFVGRLNTDKGYGIAIDVAKKLGVPIKIAGQGAIDDIYKDDPLVEHVGYVNIEQRDELMGNALATFVPTQYVEPLGSVLLESLLTGTPVITSDFGAFPEINLHGVTGYRCRTMDDYIWAARNIHNIKTENCRLWAQTNFCTERISKMYAEYFSRIQDLLSGGSFYSVREGRSNLDWLAKYYINPL